MLVNLTVMLFSVTLKIVHYAENYARMMLAEISPLNPRYQAYCCNQASKPVTKP